MSSSTTLAGPPMLKSSVETELLKDSPQKVLDHLAEMTPLRRLGRPEDNRCRRVAPGGFGW
jgi:hypothetical protein